MVRNLDDLVAFQFAETFKLEVYKLIEASPKASRSFKYREQLEDASAGIERAIAEGFGRFRPAEFAQFLRYALASLAEARTCLQDGIDRGYFSEADCATAFAWAGRCRETSIKLLVSQVRQARKARTPPRAPSQRPRLRRIPRPPKKAKRVPRRAD